MSLSTYRGVEWHNAVGRGVVAVAAGAANAIVLDCRGCRTMTAYFAGTCTYLPCDEDGIAATGESAASFTSGTTVPVIWPFYEIEAGTSAAQIATV